MKIIVKCPYCNYTNDAIFVMESNPPKLKCHKCGKVFIYEEPILEGKGVKE